MSITVVVPCAGRSSRYPGERPKWALPDYEGRPMIQAALGGLDLVDHRIVVTVLAEHEVGFDASRGLREALGDNIDVLVLEAPTGSQTETVAETIRRAGISGPVLIKDSDNRFVLEALPSRQGYVCTESLNHFDAINPRNKSYVETDHTGLILNIREKRVISDQFSVGGYFFPDASMVTSQYEKLGNSPTTSTGELYLSDVISALILDGVTFHSRPVTGYEDWGTIKEWRNFLLRHRTVMVAVDGFLFEHGSRYFPPRYEDVTPQEKAFTAVNSLAKDGHSLIFLSSRPEGLRTLTESQLAGAGAPDAPLIMQAPAVGGVLVTGDHPLLRSVGGSVVDGQVSIDELVEQLGVWR